MSAMVLALPTELCLPRLEYSVAAAARPIGGEQLPSQKPRASGKRAEKRKRLALLSEVADLANSDDESGQPCLMPLRTHHPSSCGPQKDAETQTLR